MKATTCQQHYVECSVQSRVGCIFHFAVSHEMKFRETCIFLLRRLMYGLHYEHNGAPARLPVCTFRASFASMDVGTNLLIWENWLSFTWIGEHNSIAHRSRVASHNHAISFSVFLFHRNKTEMTWKIVITTIMAQWDIKLFIIIINYCCCGEHRVIMNKDDSMNEMKCWSIKTKNSIVEHKLHATHCTRYVSSS